MVGNNKIFNKKKINNTILKKYDDIEQVGFINKNKPKLIMAGGEFCVNATRSAINYYLNNRPGRVNIKIPNLHTTIMGGIDKDDETWIYLNTFQKVKTKYCKTLNQNISIIYFKGIVHAIINNDIIKKKSEKEI